jgi:uncharacterized protein YvpB
MIFPKNVFGAGSFKGEGKIQKVLKKPAFKIAAFFFVAAIFILLALFNTLLFNKTVFAASSTSGQSVSVKSELSIRYNKRVKHEAQITIEPNAEYETVWIDKFNDSTLVIKPKERWQTATEYKIMVDGIQNIFNVDMPSANLAIKTQSAPQVSATEPANNATNVPIVTAIKVTLDSPNHDLISPRIFFEPQIPSKFKLSEDKMFYEISFDSKLSQSANYKYFIYDSFINDPSSEYGKKIYEGTFTTVPKLEVDNHNLEGGGVLVDSEIKIHFNQITDRTDIESKFSIEPKVDGTINWFDDQTMVFKPASKLPFATNFTYKIAKGAKSIIGGELEVDVAHTFTTIGHVTASFSPGWGATEIVPNKAINIYFNQEVDHASAQSKFAISPNSGGSFGWSGNTMVYYPTSQSAYTTYTASVAAGVKSVRGLDSVSNFSTQYTTQVPNVKLNVNYDRQDYALSCEFASLKMALAEQGVYVSENQLFSLVPFYNGSKTWDNKWGNPYVEFVGNISGNGTTTGYGVYWGPIASAARNYRSATEFTGGSAQTLTAAINAGAPIVIWGPYGSGYRMDWTDINTGQNIYAVKGEHARVVSGYKGPADNPWGFYIVDPLFGQFYWSTSQLLANWGWFNNSGVIVY